ncbi:NAD(P)-dependent iron-only hydrogenase catalytic subunit [Orenia metallireducens]|uniref:NAD(P)-dependent iron-only hydrogenase catalytic subunit n=1 Tax=Orenia metallireducens TaxID=1413210 RepID=A0A285GB77_9FIRM|nr:NADH-dependent [FeFe] hydrogenase, group A6 [Orenia metallireducens]SNY20817.1 NAD(P)-dependent iron-only hydrogenase catalytic subunit [Orenia metallireducens]
MDTITLTIDGQQVEVQQGATLLEAARELGIEIPTLCYHPDLSLHGSCRVCVVEDVKSGRLLASCVSPVNDGMEISTNSSKARVARKTNVELLLANHPNDCLGCDRNGSCELQDITHDLGITRVDFEGEKRNLPVDATGPSLKREPNKCILCGRCVRVCEEVQGVSALEFTERGFNSIVSTGFDLPQSEVNCANCGQCATVCPTAALTEISEVDKVWAALEDDTKHVVVQTAPSIQSSLGEEFGMEAGTVVTGKMAAALRRLGFDRIFTTDFAADLTIMEEGNEFIKRFKGEKNLPHITSCCPGWVKFCEHNYPDLISHLSSAKSPMSMFSAISKSYYAEESDIDAKEIYTVAIMPCTAKKFEKEREELAGDTDAVLTTRELARMIKEVGINFTTLADEQYDEMLGAHTGAGTIFGTTGGVTEAALRTVKEELDGEPLGRLGLGFEGIQEASLEVAGQTVNVAIANGLANASKLLDEVRAGNSKYHFIEVMACPNGCVGGGGQPLPTSKEIKQKRALGLRSIDESDSIRKSHENPMIKKLYDDYLGEPLGGHSHHLLHTKYQKRDKN